MNKNDLIPVITQEECAEVIQSISKVFRFGKDQLNPYTGTTNIYELEIEIGQLLFMIERLSDHWQLNKEHISKAYMNKRDTLDYWTDFYKGE